MRSCAWSPVFTRSLWSRFVSLWFSALSSVFVLFLFFLACLPVCLHFGPHHFANVTATTPVTTCWRLDPWRLSRQCYIIVSLNSNHDNSHSVLLGRTTPTFRLCLHFDLIYTSVNFNDCMVVMISHRPHLTLISHRWNTETDGYTVWQKYLCVIKTWPAHDQQQVNITLTISDCWRETRKLCRI